MVNDHAPVQSVRLQKAYACKAYTRKKRTPAKKHSCKKRHLRKEIFVLDMKKDEQISARLFAY